MGYSEKMQQVQQAYYELEPVQTTECPECVCENTFEGVEVDGIDTAYVFVRTFIPSWLMGLILVIGALTVLNSTLNKFGIQLITRVKK